MPDFPKPGILFYDITTLLKDKAGLPRRHRRAEATTTSDTQVDVVLGIEARGFIFAPALAYALGAGFVPVRKPKKLPAECVQRHLRSGVRHRHPGDAQATPSCNGQPRADRRRPAGHRRHRRGGGAHGAARRAASWWDWASWSS